MNKVLIGFLVGLATALGGGMVAWLQDAIAFDRDDPVAVLAPSEITVNKAEPISFDARQSNDPERQSLRFTWTVGANPLERTGVASCRHASDPGLLNCQFAMPGTHAVSVVVATPDGREAMAQSSVTVRAPNGYLGLFLQGPPDGDSDAVSRAFLYGVDWTAVQSVEPNRPIVLYDPDITEWRYAVAFEHDVDKAREIIDRSRGLREFDLIASDLSPMASRQVAADLAQLGILLRFLPGDPGALALSEDAASRPSGFMTMDSPGDLEAYFRF